MKMDAYLSPLWHGKLFKVRENRIRVLHPNSLINDKEVASGATPRVEETQCREQGCPQKLPVRSSAFNESWQTFDHGRLLNHENAKLPQDSCLTFSTDTKFTKAFGADVFRNFLLPLAIGRNKMALAVHLRPCETRHVLRRFNIVKYKEM